MARPRSGLQTEFDFVLPRGFVAPDGSLHRKGRMRLATAMDEIAPLRDLFSADLAFLQEFYRKINELSPDEFGEGEDGSPGE